MAPEGSTPNRQANVLLKYCVGGVLAAVLLPLVSNLAALLLCVVLIVGYAARSTTLYKRQRDIAGLLAAADEVYLLAYLFTISALLGIGLQLWWRADTFNTSRTALLFLISTKLSTTAVGLIAMLYLKGLAGAAVSAPPRLFELLPDRGNVSLPLKDSEEYTQNLQQTISSMQEFGRILQDIHKDMDRLSEAVVSTSSDISSFSKNVTDMQKILDDFVAIVKRKLLDDL